MMKRAAVLTVVMLAMLASAQDHPCPLQVLKLGQNFSDTWPDGTPKTLKITVQNVGDKEVVAAQYSFAYTDTLGQSTGEEKSAPVDVHESGHKTLRPGKKATEELEAPLLHPHQRVEASVVLVKFADGSLWKSSSKEGQ